MTNCDALTQGTDRVVLDVDAPADQEILVYDSTSNTWYNTINTGGSGTSGSSGTSGTSGAGGAYTLTEKSNIELHTAYEAAIKLNTKLLTYDATSNLLIEITVNDSTSNLLFTKVFAYDVNDNLETILLTRNSDSATLTKTLGYDINGYLTSIIET